MRKLGRGAAVLVIMAGLCLAGCSSPANSEGGETAREAADAFKTAHAAALGKTVDTLTAGDKAAVDAALSAYAALTAEAKALLGAEKALLDSLKTKLQTLGITAFTILNEDGNLVSDIPENIHISKGARESFSITTTGDLTHIRWSLNWAAIPDPRGSARIISFEAASFSVGSYTVTLYAEKDGIPYLFNAVFIVEN